MQRAAIERPRRAMAMAVAGRSGNRARGGVMNMYALLGISALRSGRPSLRPLIKNASGAAVRFVSSPVSIDLRSEQNEHKYVNVQ